VRVVQAETGDVVDNFAYGVVVLDHFLMVAAALVRGARLDGFADEFVYLGVAAVLLAGVE
jgi:hypothetical protein